MKNLTLIATLSITAPVMARVSAPNVVYGVDSRIETYQASSAVQKLAASTAGMIKNSDLLSIGEYTILPPRTLKQAYGLCEGELFADQANPMDCSGFLVGPDLLVTAGHCIQKQADCDTLSWVFDYKIDEKTGRAPVMLPSKNVYKCKEVIEAKLDNQNGKAYDYSLVRLERVAKDRAPLKVRTSGKISDGDAITVIGHPSGLPQKVAGDAVVVENAKENFFQANLDTFGGNSGSAVFNDETGVVEGILVRGAKDYDSLEEGCMSVHETTQAVSDFSRYGESVSRITDVKTLKFTSALLAAAKEGNLEKFKAMADELEHPNVYDNEMNSALHYAAEGDMVEIVDYLIERGVDLKVKNAKGLTAYKIAVKNRARLVLNSFFVASRRDR